MILTKEEEVVVAVAVAVAVAPATVLVMVACQSSFHQFPYRHNHMGLTQ
jgi:hypothetical protein